MQLAECPKMISAASKIVADVELQIVELERRIKAESIQIDVTIAENSDLKNDTQRKAHKSLLMAARVGDLIATQQLLEHELRLARIQQAEMQNVFEVLKLEARLKIGAC